MIGHFLLLFYLFKLVGIKSINDLRKRFGNPDISMPPNSTKEEWIKALQNACKEKSLRFESVLFNFVAEKDRQASNIVFTHAWFLWPYKNIMTAVEYDSGQPKIALMSLKNRIKTVKRMGNSKLGLKGRQGLAGDEAHTC